METTINRHQTPWHLWAFLILVSGMFLVLANGCKKKSSGDTTVSPITDVDGNIYHSVTIGKQVWMVENLKVTHYRNGEVIPEITDASQWKALTSGGLCWYNNDPPNFKKTYGAFYNWYAVSDSRMLSPAGWHIPTDAEWTTLTDFLGGESVAGEKMKESSTIYWTAPNTAGDNSSGFTALPGGSRNDAGLFFYLRDYAFMWSATEQGGDSAMIRYITSNNPDVYRTEYLKTNGFSVRCVKD